MCLWWCNSGSSKVTSVLGLVVSRIKVAVLTCTSMHIVNTPQHQACFLHCDPACTQVGDSCWASRVNQGGSLRMLPTAITHAQAACYLFNLDYWQQAAQDLLNVTDIDAPARAVGYRAAGDLAKDAEGHIEPLYLLSTFCLTPSGDTPKRRGFFDAIQMGCAFVAWRMMPLGPAACTHLLLCDLQPASLSYSDVA